MEQETLWLMIGFLGQAFFFSRFFVQWIASEREKRSVVPNAFWFLSLGGGAMLLIYALYRQDPVFVVGQICGVFIYSRNLYLIYGPPASGRAAGNGDSSESASPESASQEAAPEESAEDGGSAKEL